MLGRLVNKFQQHSLRDEQTLNDNSVSLGGFDDFRRNLIPSLLYTSSLNDSGTESENDEELEQLESSYLMSLAADEGHLGPSPPVITSSPPLISDFDTNSWDSTGCESGIVIREQSDEPNDFGSALALEQQYSFPINSASSHSLGTGNEGTTVAAGGLAAANSEFSEVASFSVKCGAFRPFRGRTREQDGINLLDDLAPSLTSQGAIGEKRRYNNITLKSSKERVLDDSANCFRGASGFGIPRETLVACRRTPVKLIIYNPDGFKRDASGTVTAPSRGTENSEHQSESPPFRPIKRGRLNSFERPFLDFEKMRERMMANSVGGQDAEATLDFKQNEEKFGTKPFKETKYRT